MFWAQKKAVPFIPGFRLQGPRVYMRYAQAGDAQAWAEVRRRNEAYLKSYEPTWPEHCLNHEFFERRLLRQQKDREEGCADSFLIFSNDHMLIGGMNINHICRGAAQYASLGYWLDTSQQGRGFMAETLELTIDHCFSQLMLHRIHAACLLHNQRSVNLLLRAGFQQEGLAEKYLKIDGAWQDHLLFGLTREKWEEKT